MIEKVIPARAISRSTTPPISSIAVVESDAVAVEAGGFAGFAVMSTTGATADWEFAVCAGAGGAAGVAAAEAAGSRVTVVRVVVLVVAVGFAGAAWAVRTVRVFVVLVVVSGGVTELSVVEDVVVVVVVVSEVVGVASVTGGVVGCVVVVGVDVEDGTSWANKGVEESARAAAIAGRALVRANRVVVVRIGNNPRSSRGWHDYRSAERRTRRADHRLLSANRAARRRL